MPFERAAAGLRLAQYQLVTATPGKVRQVTRGIVGKTIADYKKPQRAGRRVRHTRREHQQKHREACHLRFLNHQQVTPPFSIFRKTNQAWFSCSRSKTRGRERAGSAWRSKRVFLKPLATGERAGR
jgi:hypothetical protein